ncbi:MAG: WecB/TagA/CpsF family glycosyl transferase N-acetylglucosaminyldiphosphoundecaprenol, partial [Candidatus Peribacteria bacterium]|nr:WecB/TagA/CpsF family glycosyl transferase N-acetylglucosaminyldiphosphoundecaprenol [Candidatus Peribacteria bacterium]
QLKNPNLQVVGTYSGSPRGEDAGQIVSVIQKARPAILFVAYGAPAQDMWIDEHMQKLPSVRVAMGVGGTFDFLAGVARRAPVGIRNMHLEWLWRVALEPWRIKRIWTAVVVFPWLVVRHGKGLSFKLH